MNQDALDWLAERFDPLLAWLKGFAAWLSAKAAAALAWLEAMWGKAAGQLSAMGRPAVDLDGMTLAVLAASAAVAAGAWLLWRRRASTGAGDAATTEPLEVLLRRPKALGFAVVLLLVGGFGSWAATAPLSSAAVAPGLVSPDGNRKTIQHLEGGIIRRIHVREGQAVEPGQRLLTLEDIRAKAEFETLRERYIHLLATEARLMAEELGAPEIEFPAELARMDRDEVRRAIASQRELFANRRATRRGEEQILGQRIKQLNEQIAGLREVIAAQDEQIALIAREIKGVQQLYDKGLERLPRLLALQRAQADIRGTRAGNRSEIARSEQRIGETEMQLLTLRQQDLEKASEQLAEVRAELARLRSQFPLHEDVLSRTVVQAPMAGTVLNVRVTTESGVVRPGEPLLDIVPAEAKLVIDARVRPTDIDDVQAGMMARVVLVAYRQRHLPQIHGTVRSLSADRLVDERTGEPYFLAKVEVDPEELDRLGDLVRLAPGMPAEVMILTGEQTFLDYLIRPLSDSVRRSFRES